MSVGKKRQDPPPSSAPAPRPKIGDVKYPLAALCERVGVSRRELDRAILEGALDERAIATTAGGYKKIVDIELAERLLRDHLDGAGAGLGVYDFEEARARREHFAALREELRYRNECGELMARGETERAIASAMTLLRQRIEQIPGQHAAELAALEEAFEVEQVLRRAIGVALEGFVVKVGEVELEHDPG